MNAAKKEELKTNIGLAATIAGFLITIVAWFGLSPETVGDALYSAISFAIPFAMFGFGLLAGSNAERWRVSRKVQESLPHEDFMMAPMWAKTMLKAASDKGAVYCALDQWESLEDNDKSFLLQYVSPETHCHNHVRLVGKAALTQLARMRPEVFDVVSESEVLERCTVWRGLDKILQEPIEGRLDWWWYSTETHRVPNARGSAEVE